MEFNKYNLRLLILIVLISGLGALSIWSFASKELVLSKYILSTLWISSIVLFYRYLHKTNSSIRSFILNIKEGDFIYLPEFGKDLNDLIRSLNNEIKTISLSKEEQNHLFTTAVNQAGSGIIVFDETGNIELINKSAQHLSGNNEISNIQSLSGLNTLLPQKLLSDEKSFIISIHLNNELLKISVNKNKFKLNNHDLNVCSIQNISEELNKEEIEAWKKLMHVITHEIMNSVTPMKTLAFSLYDIFNTDNKPQNIKAITQEQIDDSFLGLKALNNRTQGLMKFVESYRKLYKIPNPNFTNFYINDVVEEVAQLFKDLFIEKRINFKVSNNDNIEILADRNMITQLIINLVKNSIEAIETTPKPSICLEISKLKDQTEIIVSDNGKGMSNTELGNIFVPFYTTKSNGSGIGLYYSKMIVYMHKGKISVKSQKNRGTSFIIYI